MAACYKANKETYDETPPKTKSGRSTRPGKFLSDEVEWFAVAENRFDNFMIAAERHVQKADRSVESPATRLPHLTAAGVRQMRCAPFHWCLRPAGDADSIRPLHFAAGSQPWRRRCTLGRAPASGAWPPPRISCSSLGRFAWAAAALLKLRRRARGVGRRLDPILDIDLPLVLRPPETMLGKAMINPTMKTWINTKGTAPQ